MAVKTSTDSKDAEQQDRQDKVWNIMVYMAADNNLAEEMVWALTSMFDVAIQELLDSVSVSVLYDSGGPPVHFTLKNLSARDLRHLPDHGIRRGWDVPMAEQLKRLIVSSVKKYNAPNRMLILSGHGSGAVGDFLSSNTSHLSVPDLCQIIRDARADLRDFIPDKEKTLTILGLDSCLMSMAEVAFEVQDHVSYLIGAEGFEPNTGWPYKRFLEILAWRAKDQGIPGPEDLAKYTVQDYIDFYAPYALADLSTDLSALDLGRIGGLTKALNYLADGLYKAIPDDQDLQDKIVIAHWRAQAYKDEQYVDLCDFCKLLERQLRRDYPMLADASRSVHEAIWQNEQAQTLVLAHDYCGAAFQYSNGLSVFFPWADLKDADGNSDLELYKDLRFAQQTGWHRFLTTYVNETRRPPNNPQDQPESRKKHSRLNWRGGTTRHHGKYNPDVSARYNPDVSARYNPDVSARTNIASRIANMKNPAVDWYLNEHKREQQPNNK